MVFLYVLSLLDHQGGSYQIKPIIFSIYVLDRKPRKKIFNFSQVISTS